MAVRPPSQVFMEDIDAPTTDDKGQDDDPNKHWDAHLRSRTSDHDNTGLATFTLGAVGTIPRKVYKGLEHRNHRSDEPESSKRQTSGTAKEDHRVEKIYLSKEAIARVKYAVKHGRLLPENATRDELRAYNKLASDVTKKTRQQQLELEKQGKNATDLRTNCKPPPRSDSYDYDSPV